MKWLPNAITSLRILGGFALLICAANEAWTAAFWVFIASLISDFFDGLAAKKLDAMTPFGELLDSLADGWLTSASLIGLSVGGHLSWWVTGIAIAVGVSVQVERRLLPHKSNRFATAKKMFAIVCLFVAWIYITLSLATLAFGWHWWYVALTLLILAASALLKRHRLRAWLGMPEPRATRPGRRIS